MAQGLAVPVRVGPRGGAALSKGDKENGKGILLAMGEGDNEHPWNGDVGLDAPLFSVQQEGVNALVESRIRQHFERLNRGDRAKLMRVEFASESPGELAVGVKYLDIETDEEKTVLKTVAREGV